MCPLTSFRASPLTGRCRGRSPLPGFQGCPLAPSLLSYLPSLKGGAGGGSSHTEMVGAIRKKGVQGVSPGEHHFVFSTPYFRLLNKYRIMPPAIRLQ